MDKKEASEALSSADAIASRMQGKNRRPGPLVFLLGLAMTLMTAAYGLLIEPSTPHSLPILLLIPFFALVIYTATRPVLPRHYRTLYALTTTTGAAVYSLAVTLGTVYFSGEPLWWVPAAVLCGLPFFVIGVLDRKAARTPGTRP
ncbi:MULTISPECIES: hypothetical protein [unclassified Streptomyces]|uniref:hypothetical protein n=1 Tax=unclassified Streptomyces TaxID=2593676 RepID=UPI001BE76225|nr:MULTISPECIES: hypothetical protein [unclassified Streptomyces]MBT2406301.1 hypothetical protein [Streptomyces sp. ISL-21]MBT2607382.1 hypothetical protein [Streptomyces sp. ISL-87]